MAESNKLTPKQDAFCREYLVDLNATQAAIRAGYSEKTAAEQASRLLTNVKISERVKELSDSRRERVQIDADYVLKQAIKIHERCMQEVKPVVTRGGEQVTDDDGNPVYGFDAKGAVASLKLVGDHINVQAFKQQTELSGGISIEPKGLDDFYGKGE